MSYERRVKRPKGQSHEGRPNLSVVSGETPYPRTRWMLRIGNGRGIEHTVATDIFSAKMLKRISDEQTGIASSEAIVRDLPFSNLEEVGRKVASTRATLAYEGVDLHFGVNGYSLRDSITRQRLKVMQTSLITEHTNERARSEHAIEPPHLFINKESGEVAAVFSDHTNTAILENSVVRNLLLHIVSHPGKIFTYEELADVIDANLSLDSEKINIRKPRVGIYMSKIRRKLQGEGFDTVIETIPRDEATAKQRFNYRFNGTVEFVGPQH